LAVSDEPEGITRGFERLCVFQKAHRFVLDVHRDA
jgi:hypothetical protein